MRTKVIVLFVLLLGLCFASCGIFMGKKGAEKAANQYLQDRVQNGGYGDKSYYSKDFWKATDEAKWSQITSLVDVTMGKLKGYKLKDWNVSDKKIMGTGLSGTVAVLLYDTEYENGKGVETITMFRKAGESSYSIKAIHFNSDKIKKYINESLQKNIDASKRSGKKN